MDFLRDSMLYWIINPITMFNTLIGADCTADSTIMKADTTATTADCTTI